MKEIKLSEKQMINYYIKEQKVIDYGQEFFKEICCCALSTENCPMINDEVLPIICYNETIELIRSVELGLKYKTVGGFISACNKQAYIRIGIDSQSDILKKNLQRTIRHEIIHYVLWLLDLPFEDDSLEFWCLATIYDAHPYQKMSADKNKYLKLFMAIYDEYVKELPRNAWCLIVGQMITSIHKLPYDKYKSTMVEMIEKVKSLLKC